MRILWLWLLLFSPRAEAFCGFFVNQSGEAMYADASRVVMMRADNRTVMSMQNHYDGPPEDFALVVPVPVILAKEDVRTLPHELFDRVDQLTAPRLVAYWEQDPCMAGGAGLEKPTDMLAARYKSESEPASRADGGVRIEARFAVGEYDILILSAQEAAGLERWLHEHQYRIPDGAAELLRGYVAQGMYFFVARVDASRVRRVDGRVLLSPLRFSYESATFALPIRLGLANARDSQDLIVYLIGRTRFESANRPNAFIPTNLRVDPSVDGTFSSFYADLFDSVVQQQPETVVTEYAWATGSCDPCPGPTLSRSDLATLGEDTVVSKDAQIAEVQGRPARSPADPWVITRLHTRYGRDTSTDDLVFRSASPVSGGRGHHAPTDTGATPASSNSFQGRYIILHPWEGPVACTDPNRGVWAGPSGGDVAVKTSTNDAFAPRGQRPASSLLLQPLPPMEIPAVSAPPPARACGCQQSTLALTWPLLLLMAARRRLTPR